MPDPRMFRSPIVRVGLADSRRRYYDIEAGDEPFFIYDRMADLGKQKKLVSSYFPKHTLKQFGNQNVSHCMLVDRKWLKGTLLRPFYRQPIPWVRADGTPTRRWGVYVSPGGVDWPGKPLGTVCNDFWDYYTFWPTAGANWDFTLADDGLLWEMTQKVSYTGTGENANDWVTSVVGFAGTPDPDYPEISRGLSPNPFFTAGFRRQAIPPEFLAAAGVVDPVEWNGKELDAEKIGFGWTQIVWGVNAEVWPQGKWMLHCPLTGEPKLYERMNTGHPWSSENQPYWLQREWTEGKLSEIKTKKAAEEGYTYHIGTMGHAICVTEGDFENGDFAYYMADNCSEPIVPYGEMFMRNWPGQCSFWLDLNVFPVGNLERWPFQVPSFRAADCANLIHGQPFSEVLQEATDPPADAEVVSTIPGVEGMAAYLLPLGLYADMAVNTLLRYTLQMVPGTYPIGADPTAEVVTQTVPFVEAVTVFQSPQLTQNSAPTFTETDRAVAELKASNDLEDDSVGKHELVVDNRLATYTPPAGEEPAGGWCPTADFTKGRQVEIQQIGWKFTNLNTHATFDSVVSLGKYWIVSSGRRAAEARFVVTDLLGMLALECWEGETELNFRGWKVCDAIAFGLEYQGVGPEQYDLEDNGLVVPDSDKFVWKRGDSWLKVYRGLLDVGGTIWYDWTDSKVKTGCRYCRQKRTWATLLTHADNGWASSACLAYDLTRVPTTGVDIVAVEDMSHATARDTEYIIPRGAFERSEATLDDASYANSIVVTGKQPRAVDGWADIPVRWRNRKALDPTYYMIDQDTGEPIEDAPADPTGEYMGFVVSKVVDDDHLENQWQVMKRLSELVNRLSTEPVRIRFKIPLLNTMRPGYVVQIEGAKWAQCHDQKFRVTGVRHDPADAMTEIRARQMLGSLAD